MLKRLTLLLTSGDKSVLFEERSFCSTFRIYIEEETLGFMDVILQWSPSRNFFFFFLLQTMFDWRHVLMMHEIGKSLFAKRIPPPLLQSFLHKYVLIFFPRIIIFHNLWCSAKSCKTFFPDLAKQTTKQTRLRQKKIRNCKWEGVLLFCCIRLRSSFSLSVSQSSSLLSYL